ncbi:hypothetical protein BGX33_000112 [Mortierella sp. NVP41]|nr:hypothetical protein BGX33_000112 [Mortierella sp. NVP41]
MIDKKAIRIRPYCKDDKEQVLETLALGFSLVGDRIFQSTVRSRSTVLSILAKSLTYTLVLELAIVTLSTVNISSPSSSGHSVLEEFRALQEVLMRPESVQELVDQFLKPSFILLGAVITLLVTLSTIYSIYRSNLKDTEMYLQGCIDEDLGDITAYYQEDIVAVTSEKQEKTNKKKKTTTTRKNRSQFWVACLESHPQLVLGCISLDDISAHTESLRSKHLKYGGTPETFKPPSSSDAELRRLSVHPNYRRLGISKMLVQTLRDSAKRQGFKRVILSTTIHQSEALMGYIRFGFDKERLVWTEPFFTWFGVLDLCATQEEKDAQKEKQDALIREVGANIQ